jgi:hypothetical protein
MNTLPDIINTPIILTRWDSFWQTPDHHNLLPKQVLVISLPFVPNSEEANQLQKILAACKLSEEQVQLLSLKKEEEIAWHHLRDIVQPKQVLLFGIEPAQLGISAHLMPHQVSRFNGSSWMQTLSLDELIKRPEIKTHLWNYGMKPVFLEKIYG